MELTADFSVFKLQCDELTSLALESGDVPESILHKLRTLIHEIGIGNELAFSCAMPAGGASEAVVVVSFRKGGKFDSCVAALRALRNGNSCSHSEPIVSDEMATPEGAKGESL